VLPASPYPAHATLVTGELPARHGVAADRLLGEHGVRRTLYWHASHLKVPTLWQRALEAQMRVAAFDWPSTVGASIELLVPDVAPVRRGETWLGGRSDLDPAGRDALLTRLACESVGSATPPKLLLLRLSQTAASLARFGPAAPEARAAFGGADADLERLLDCLRSAGRLASSAVAVVGDGGMLPVHTRVNPNVVLARERLLGDSAQDKLRWRAIVRSNGGSAFVYANRESDAVAARRILEEAAQETRAFRVVPARELLSLGSDPEAWFGLEASAGFVFGSDASGPMLEPATLRGASGYLPGQRETWPGFVAWGRGVRRRVRVPRMRQSDVAPTLARLLGIPLQTVDGRALVGALDVPDRAVSSRAERVNP
jgi:predicted AlkP superfamily pyrophosphatase or phosphodiesterase